MALLIDKKSGPFIQAVFVAVIGNNRSYGRLSLLEKCRRVCRRQRSTG
jgi:hypothetical protein